MASSKAMHRFVSCAAAVLLISTGCGKGDRGYLSGTVLLSGQPVGPGTISLEPLDGDRAGATAAFGEDGKYTLMSAGRKEGAAVGEYRVLIYGGEGFGEERVGPRPKSKIPARYSNPQTSDLMVTIEPEKKTVDFDLKP
jgi:hypothetical protein